MAFVPLNISPVWRPWRQAGVRHLLTDPDVAERLRCTVSSPVRECGVPSDAGREGTQVRQAPAEPSRTPPVEVPAASLSGGSCTAPPGPSSSAVPILTDSASWPASWQMLLRRCGSPAPAVLWTYPGLAEDLGGVPDNRRRNFFRRLFRDLAMPKGSHAFWPLQPSADRRSGADAAFFYSGVAVLNPDLVILMCDELPPTLNVPRMRPFQAVIHRERRYVQLHDPTQLAGQLDGSAEPVPLYARLLGFLKALTTRA